MYHSTVALRPILRTARMQRSLALPPVSPPSLLPLSAEDSEADSTRFPEEDSDEEDSSEDSSRRVLRGEAEAEELLAPLASSAEDAALAFSVSLIASLSLFSAPSTPSPVALRSRDALLRCSSFRSRFASF